MSKAENALKLFESYNCAQSVLAAYAKDFGLEKEKALSIAAGFGGGMGRLQETCGAVSGAIAVLGLASDYKEADGRDKINTVYAQVRRLAEDFKREHGTVKCRDLLSCELLSEEGHKYFNEHNLRKTNCGEYIRLCCGLLDKYLAKEK